MRLSRCDRYCGDGLSLLARKVMFSGENIRISVSRRQLGRIGRRGHHGSRRGEEGERSQDRNLGDLWQITVWPEDYDQVERALAANYFPPEYIRGPVHMKQGDDRVFLNNKPPLPVSERDAGGHESLCWRHAARVREHFPRQGPFDRAGRRLHERHDPRKRGHATAEWDKPTMKRTLNLLTALLLAPPRHLGFGENTRPTDLSVYYRGDPR
jgi:hypothetical protein